MIEFIDVSKVYENVPALSGLSFKIEKGEFVFITGPSGAGKSTLLKLVYLAERPTSGRIRIAGWDFNTLKKRAVPIVRRNIGVVFQDYKLLENRTVYENIAIALRIRGYRERDIKDRVQSVLKLVNLRHKMDAYPATLSGGEQQRIAIARAIVGEPTIIVADEPTGNLDAENTESIMKIFKKIHSKGTTILFATHNRELYQNKGLRQLALKEGRILSDSRYSL